MPTPQYDQSGNLIGVNLDDGSSVPFSTSNRDWNAYVDANGMPPLTGASTIFVPVALPQNVQNAVSTLKAYMNTTPIAQGQPGFAQDQAIRALVIAVKQIWQAAN